MCTLIFAWQVFEDAPVLIAANRDEALGRPSHPPGLYSETPRIVAPWDEEAGGTWIGSNEHGVAAVVTNRWLDTELAAERSRGLLVGEALERESAEDAARFVEHSVREFEYDGFNLALIDANAAILLEWNGGLRVRNFDPGVHVVVNVGADGDFEIPAERAEFAERQAESARRAREVLRPDPGERPREWHERAVAVLQDHEYTFCVHADEYGTRSSSLIRVNADGTTEYRFADGPPCETAYEPIDT
ncbi:NRDE family protein [Halalkalicoccus jeotgali]|uniref:NRDE family protein n=1 Tax=Halalkalicoccus jeotgali (strain DSM 18796 / CECT 7217 / JCM 14584 / KCTC 4019 / B3) TaxID=795797 RepID=D8J2K4_HALJB|nr:NRDE family protein [Halalkalicoccus jeotgali]ADJ14961.1 hypothetical protein HacjB3_07880 [Halalkalicoccus jeotgali B3]ELY35023.1 hypothetical protein C497_14842 [Halalkalicoccus jeotgali B3]